MTSETPIELGGNEPGSAETKTDGKAEEATSDVPEVKTDLDELLRNFDDATDKNALLNLLNIC